MEPVSDLPVPHWDEVRDACQAQLEVRLVKLCDPMLDQNFTQAIRGEIKQLKWVLRLPERLEAERQARLLDERARIDS